MKTKNVVITISALLILAVFVISMTTSFSIVPTGQTVWIPDYGTVACKQTRLACAPGICNDVNPEFKSINKNGENIYCGAPTLTDANFYEGCKLYIYTSGAFDFSSYKVCDSNGQCQNLNLPTSSTTFGGKSTRQVSLKAGQYAYVNPNLADVSYNIVAPVYGLAIEGAVKPSYADRCNIAQLMNDKQIATLKGSDDYVQTIQAGEISPGNFPIVFITGYKAQYGSDRIITKNGDSWFIESVGYRCKVVQDSNNRYIVSDECTTDSDIQCFPNVGNCDKNAKLIKTTDGTGKSCTPGTLIGTSTGRIPISATQACQSRCSSDGVPENYNCVSIPKSCPEGKVLGSDYTCTTSTQLTDKEKCEAAKGSFKETVESDGTKTATCNYGTDNFVLYVIAGTLVVLALLFAVYMKVKK